VAVATLVGCEVVESDPTPPEGDDDDAQDTVVVATVGPQGGELVLPNGTAWEIPPGALTNDVELTLAYADAEATGPEGAALEDYAFARILRPFVVSPTLISAGDPFTFVLPTDADPEDIVLVFSGEGANGRLHLPRSPASTEAGAALIEVSHTAPVLYQPMEATHALEEDIAASGSCLGERCHGSGPVGHPCSWLIATAGLPAIPGIDAEWDVQWGLPPAWLTYWQGLSAPDQTTYVANTTSAVARTCVAAHKVLDYYTNTLAMPSPQPPGPLALSVLWQPANCATWAEANGLGMNLYLDTSCTTPTGAGYLVTFPPPAAGEIGWNDAGPDILEFNTAHELFHTVEDWAELVAGNGLASNGGPYGAGGGAFSEGGADCAAQEFFDTAHSASAALDPAPIWDGDAWNAGTLGAQGGYAMHTFWRFLEATRDVPARGTHVLQQILAAVRTRANAGAPDGVLPADVDAAIAASFPSIPGYARGPALADFATAYLFTHDFERAVDDFDGNPVVVDAYPDAYTVTADETGLHQLWAPWTWNAAVLTPDVDTVTNPNGIAVVAAGGGVMPGPIGTALPGWGAMTMSIDMTPEMVPDQPTVTLTLEALDSGGAPVGHVAVRVLIEDIIQRSQVLASVDSLSINPASPTVLTIPGGRAQWGPIIVVATNVDTPDVLLTITVALKYPSLYVLARNPATLLAFEVGRTTATARLLGGAPDLPIGGRGRSLEVGGPLGATALTTLSSGELPAFVLTEGSEYELDHDGDPATTDPGAPAGVTRAVVGGTPRGMAVMPDGAHALIARETGVVWLDIATRTVVGEIPAALLRTQGTPRPWDVALLPDASKAYVGLFDFANPTDEVAVLDVPTIEAEAASGGFTGTFSAATVRTVIDVDGGNPHQLAVSPDGAWVTAAMFSTHGVALIDTSIDAVVDAAPSRPERNHWFAHWEFVASKIPMFTAWGPDSAVFYVGYTSGHPDGLLSGNGTVRRCELADEHCDHEVGVEGSVRGLTVVGDAFDPIVWVVDTNGAVTALEERLFIPENAFATRTSGTDPWGFLDGTGGCVVFDGLFEWQAEPCPAAATAGISLSEVVFVP
jgi:DNA-binding beta-propeller fold protein YncE